MMENEYTYPVTGCFIPPTGFALPELYRPGKEEEIINIPQNTFWEQNEKEAYGIQISTKKRERSSGLYS